MILDGDELKEVLVRKESPIDRDELFNLFESHNYMRLTPMKFAEVLIAKIPSKEALAELIDYLTIYRKNHL